ADNTSFYSASLDKTIRAWKVTSDTPRNLQHNQRVDAVAFNSTGTQLATGSPDGIVRIWDVAKATPIKQIQAHVQPMPSAVYCVAWSPDDKQIVSGSLDHSLKLWDVASGNMVRQFKGYNEKDFPKGHRDPVFCVA